MATNMSFEFDNSTLSLSLRNSGNMVSDGQLVELRLGNSSQLVFRSSHQILQQTPSTLIAGDQFPLPLRELQDPLFLSQSSNVLRFLYSFNLSNAICGLIFQEIASFALQLAAGDLDLNFHIIVAVDSIQMIYIEDSPPPPPKRRGAPPPAIERLKKEKFDGLIGAGGECSVCCDELDEGEKEVARIPCGHMYHKSCILKWLEMSNSCPLCRRELE